MPPFVDVLSAEQITLVSQYIRIFAPTLKEATAKETEMIVLDTPLVARGMIPALSTMVYPYTRAGLSLATQMVLVMSTALTMFDCLQFDKGDSLNVQIGVKGAVHL